MVVIRIHKTMRTMLIRSAGLKIKGRILIKELNSQRQCSSGHQRERYSLALRERKLIIKTHNDCRDKRNK